MICSECGYDMIKDGDFFECTNCGFLRPLIYDNEKG